MMLTGGSPTMHPKVVNELTNFANERGIVITMENEGSHYLETDYPIGLLSISPKFSNSIPVVGAVTPQGKVVDEKMIKTHNRLRKNTSAIAKSIAYHTNYHIKPVIDKDLAILSEVEEFLEELAVELRGNGYKDLSLDEIRAELKDHTWLMPAGDTRESLFESYPVVMNLSRDTGYKFTGRAHIMAFNQDREV